MKCDMVERAIDKAMSRVRKAFRAVLTNIDSTTPIQLVQADGLAGEQLQDNELMQHYGVTSVPPAGAQLVVIPIGGKTAHGIIIATEHVQYRLKGLKSGEVALYDDLGQVVYLTRSGIVIKGAGLPVTVTDTPSVTLDTPTTHMTGNLVVDGDISNQGSIATQGDLVAQGDVKDHGSKSMAGMRSTFNGHHHGASPTPDQAM
jgi:phage baseplate assembly protein V